MTGGRLGVIRRPWALAAGLLVLAAAALCAAQWPAFPYFLDSYYHLLVIQGFRDAGGPVLHAFWEAAPQGRPHLYPPLFHLLSLPLLSSGVAPIALARGWCTIAFPLLLFTAWRLFSRLSGPRAGCLAVIALTLSYSFFLGSVNHLPATLVLIQALGILLALAERRIVAGGLLLAMAFWTHAGLPWLVALALLLHGFLDPKNRRVAWAILAIGLAGGSPWLAHLARHQSMIQIQPRGEERFLDTPILALLLGAIGLVPAWRRGGVHRFLVAMAVGFLPMLALYRFRFFATQGLFPWLLLAGVALEAIGSRLRRPWAFAALLVTFSLFSPSLHGSAGGWALSWADSFWSRATGLHGGPGRPTELPLYHPRFMDALAKEIRAHVSPEELIHSNVPYFAGMLGVVSGRSTTNQMLREMADRPAAEQIRAARLVIWIKETPLAPPSRQLQEIAAQFQLRPLVQTEIAYLYFNPRATARRQVRQAVVPGWLATLLLLAVAGTAGWDFLRGRRSRSERLPAPS